MNKAQKVLLNVGLVIGLIDLLIISYWIIALLGLELIPASASLIVNGVINIPHNVYFVIMLIGGIVLGVISIPITISQLINPLFMFLLFILTSVNISTDKPKKGLLISSIIIGVLLLIISILGLDLLRFLFALLIIISSILGLVSIKKAKEEQEMAL